MAICIHCYATYSDDRMRLGYSTCLDCGKREAEEESIAKAQRVAVLHNKGGYGYITDGANPTTLGKK